MTLAELVARVPAALAALTEQTPVPIPDVVTDSDPLSPLAEPLVGPVQVTVALVAPLVVQLKVTPVPVVTLATLNELAVTAGAGTTVIVPVPVAEVPA